MPALQKLADAAWAGPPLLERVLLRACEVQRGADTAFRALERFLGAEGQQAHKKEQALSRAFLHACASEKYPGLLGVLLAAGARFDGPQCDGAPARALHAGKLESSVWRCVSSAADNYKCVQAALPALGGQVTLELLAGKELRDDDAALRVLARVVQCAHRAKREMGVAASIAHLRSFHG